MIFSYPYHSIQMVFSGRKQLCSFLFLLSGTLFGFALFAQAPQRFSYQAVIRNTGNQLISNQAVNTKVSLLRGSLTGIAVYVETHSVSTNANGLLTLEIGSGNAVSGNFSSINWQNGPYFIKTETDPDGGTNYSITTTSQLLSVPYSLNAGNGISRVSATGDSLYLGNGNHLIIPGISAANSGSNGQVTDIDGNVYQTVTIGTQIWMKENLKVSKYRNGEAIPTNFSDVAWAVLNSGAYSIYNNDSANNSIFGKLYNWYSVVDFRGLCPVGWHVPTDHDWNLLTNYLDSSSDTTQCCNNTAGGKMKSIGTLQAGTGLWESPNTDASNISGFGGHPGGDRKPNGPFNANGVYGSWWSSTQFSTSDSYYRTLNYNNNYSYRFNASKQYGFSIRCLKD